MLDTDASTAGDGKVRKRMTVFRSSEGPAVGDMMSFEGIDDTVKAGFEKMMAAGAREVHGEITKCIFREPGENGMSLCYGWFKSNYAVPRHSHSADCIYYILAGEMHMGNAVLKKGDGVFVPADHAYTFSAGPEGVELIEVRNANKFNIFFKGNDEAHWDRLAEIYRANRTAWESEASPPLR